MNLDVLFKKNDKSNIENQILDIQSDNVSKTGSEKKDLLFFPMVMKHFIEQLLICFSIVQYWPWSKNV